MTWLKCYQPSNQAIWQGRQDAPDDAYFFQAVELLDLQKTPEKNKNAFAFLGFCSDDGVKRNLGRTGAKEGPLAIRKELAKAALHRPNVKIFDAGDILCNDDELESAQSALAEAVHILLKSNITPILLGGGHEVAWGHFQGINKHITYKKTLGIINFDAHLDMRPLVSDGKGSSGTPFLQIAKAYEENKQEFIYACLGLQPSSNITALLNIAKSHNVQVAFASDFSDGSGRNIVTALDNVHKVSEHLYITICLDVFSASIAPGVSAPQALGLTPWQVLPILKHLSSTGKVLSYDVAELCPAHDIDDRTAKLAAQLIFEIVHMHQFKG